MVFVHAPFLIFFILFCWKCCQARSVNASRSNCIVLDLQMRLSKSWFCITYVLIFSSFLNFESIPLNVDINFSKNWIIVTFNLKSSFKTNSFEYFWPIIKMKKKCIIILTENMLVVLIMNETHFYRNGFTCMFLVH